MSTGPGNTDDQDRIFAMYVTGSVFAAFWCVGCCISTKGCRKFSQNEMYFRGGVWSEESMRLPMNQELRDFRMAQRLQEMERMRASMTPEEAQALERKREARRELVEQLLPHREIDETSPCENATNEEEAGESQSLEEKEGDDIDIESNIPRCIICLANYKRGDVVVTATSGLCQHEFHRSCMAEWLLLKRGCPVCRKVFLKEDIEESDVDNAVAATTSIGDTTTGEHSANRSEDTHHGVSTEEPCVQDALNRTEDSTQASTARKRTAAVGNHPMFLAP